MPKPAITTFSSVAVKESSTNKNNGFYAPQLTTAQIATIPATTLVDGAIVYNTTTNALQTRVNGVMLDIPAGGVGVGDVIGPALSVDNNIAIFNGVTGKLIADSGVTIGRVPAPALRQSSLSIFAPNVDVNEISNLGYIKFSESGGIGVIFVDSLSPVKFVTHDFGSGTQICSLFTGQVPSDTTTVSALVELNSTDGALLLSRMTQAERGALVAPAAGMILFTTDLNSFSAFNGTNWLNVPLFNTNGTLTVATPIALTDAATKNYVDTKTWTTSQITDYTTATNTLINNATISPTKLTGYPSSTASYLRGDGTWFNFNSSATAIRLDQFAIPIVSINLNSQKIINLLNPTLAQDAATKNYVDTTLTASLANLNSKTQNISLSETTSTLTKITQDLILAGEFTTKSAPINLQAANIGSVNPINLGWSFTPTVDITVTKYKIQTTFWLTSTPTKPIAIFNNTTQALVGSIQTLDKLTIENGYYVKLLAVPLVLTAGVTYAISGLFEVADRGTSNTNTYPSEIIAVSSRYSNGPDVTAVFPVVNVGFMTGANVSFDYIAQGAGKDLQCNNVECNNVLVNTLTNSARIVVSGGVQNVSGEDSCIRATSSSNVAKIEVECTSGLGRLWEIQSDSGGNFNLFNRTSNYSALFLENLSQTSYIKQSYASYYATNGAATNIPTGGSFVKLTWPTTGVQTLLNNYSYANSRLTYNGFGASSRASINVSMTATHNGLTGEKSTFAIYKNGSLIARIRAFLVNGVADFGIVSLNVISTVAALSSDFFEIYATNTSSGVSISITELNFTISST